jgi:hypothetical protein
MKRKVPMLNTNEKFVNEILGDVLKRIREAFEEKIKKLHERNKKISDLRLKHVKEIYGDLVDTFHKDFDSYMQGNIKNFKLNDFDYMFRTFVEPHVKWMYKLIKSTYHEEHDEEAIL